MEYLIMVFEKSQENEKIRLNPRHPCAMKQVFKTYFLENKFSTTQAGPIIKN
ncbi:hypothetical protein J2X17_002562 [Flavobacterium aquidurense]|nr:hypothetical protein [Flavobacterium aquidurense]